ncbi:hypothetical protein CISG_06014 [Coccidioides immitis RMSCC 3703]|uniref:Uncharacterized protein n=1 Tax=Coccidioides immitis RMSCC 3703 TaxID=454286 RepID=A0A0J8QYQ5_COCIT|nr:hypothetical protein CISG_06014 [Coccidioides immitis RMSCC 3703]
MAKIDPEFPYSLIVSLPIPTNVLPPSRFVHSKSMKELSMPRPSHTQGSRDPIYHHRSPAAQISPHDTRQMTPQSVAKGGTQLRRRNRLPYCRQNTKRQQIACCVLL